MDFPIVVSHVPELPLDTCMVYRCEALPESIVVSDHTDKEPGFSLMCGLHLRGWQRYGSEGYHVEPYTVEQARELEAQVKAFEATHSEGE